MCVLGELMLGEEVFDVGFVDEICCDNLCVNVIVFVE